MNDCDGARVRPEKCQLVIDGWARVSGHSQHRICAHCSQKWWWVSLSSPVHWLELNPSGSEKDRKMTFGTKPWRMTMVLLLLIIGWLAPANGMSRDTLVVALQGEPEDGFDPLMGWGRDGHPLFHSTLLTRDDDLAIVNDLAVSHAVSSDGLVWSVTIRADVSFSDGTPSCGRADLPGVRASAPYAGHRCAAFRGHCHLYS
jgi:hypothetical protein